MFHKIKEVCPAAGLCLLVSFENGARRLYDVKPLLDKWEPFRALLTVEGLFQQVKRDAGGYGVSWNEELDLSCDELWQGGIQVNTEKREEQTL